MLNDNYDVIKSLAIQPFTVVPTVERYRVGKARFLARSLEMFSDRFKVSSTVIEVKMEGSKLFFEASF